MQSVNRGPQTTMRERGGESNRDAPRQRLPIAKATRRESEGRCGGCKHHSSTQLGHHKRGEGNRSLEKTQGVEISVAGGVGEMVRAQLLGNFFFFISILILFTAEAEGQSDRYNNHINLPVRQQQTSTESDPSSRRWKPSGEPLV